MIQEDENHRIKYTKLNRRIFLKNQFHIKIIFNSDDEITFNTSRRSLFVIKKYY